ncbi:PilZ domain-containing protein [Actinomadura hibisca]|uniref:PilZ domain-containing protein n=1 Tax=Actinomadura hibisca TaxID=68565 RepID=UPI00082F607C|nr:PilZ domain-containing protein [Actinomadura hibisca]
MINISPPAPGTLVEVALPDGRVHSSRSEAVAELELTITAPAGAGDIEPPGPGTVLELRWTGPRGLYTAPAVLTGVSDGRIKSWTVQATGEVRVDNRRDAARVTTSAQVRLTDAETGAEVFRGRLLDVSEGGARCRGTGPDATPDQKVIAKLVLDDRILSLPARVLSADAPDAKDVRLLVLAFNATNAEAAVINRYVLQAQIRARKANERAAG